MSDEVLRPRDAPPALGPTPTVAEQKAASASTAIARAARAKRSLRACGSSRASLRHDHTLPNAGNPATYGPKLNDFWYNRHYWTVIRTRRPLEHSKLRMRQ